MYAVVSAKLMRCGSCDTMGASATVDEMRPGGFIYCGFSSAAVSSAATASAEDAVAVAMRQYVASSSAIT